MTLPQLYTSEQVAEALQLHDLDTFHRLRKRHRWPGVQLGRFNLRFTEAQVEHIVAQHTEQQQAAGKPAASAGPLPGQTARSAARSST